MLNNTYFETNNHQLTRTKICDWLRCPNYFSKRHITGEIPEEEKSCFTTGKLVDQLLTDSPMDKIYFIGSKATKEGKQALAEGKTVITQLKWEEAFNLALAVAETEACQDLKSHKSQVEISCPINGGPHFDKLAGLLDWLAISDDGKVAIITDLKSASDIDPKKYFYHCKSYNYFLQMAVYQYILEHNYPGITCYSRHLVVKKEKDIYPCATFIIDQKEIDMEKGRIPELIAMIAADKEFKKKPVTWKNATLLEDQYGKN